MAVLHHASCSCPSIKIDARKIFITFKLPLLCVVTKNGFGHHRINDKKTKMIVTTFNHHTGQPKIFGCPLLVATIDDQLFFIYLKKIKQIKKNWELPKMLRKQWLTTTRYSLMCIWDYLGMWIIIMLWKKFGCTNVQC